MRSGFNPKLCVLFTSVIRLGTSYSVNFLTVPKLRATLNDAQSYFHVPQGLNLPLKFAPQK